MGSDLHVVVIVAKHAGDCLSGIEWHTDQSTDLVEGDMEARQGVYTVYTGLGTSIPTIRTTRFEQKESWRDG